MNNSDKLIFVLFVLNCVVAAVTGNGVALIGFAFAAWYLFSGATKKGDED